MAIFSHNDDPTRQMKRPPVAAGLPSGRTGGAGQPWRAVLKWAFSIGFTIVLFLSLVMAVMYQASGRSQAEHTIEAMMAPVLASPQFRSDLSVFTPGLLAYLEAPAFASAVYEDPEVLRQGIDGTPDNLRTTLYIISMPMTFLDSQAHSDYGEILMVLVVISLGLGLLAAAFSRRLGRLVSPGICMALAAWIPLVTVLALRSGLAGRLSSGAGGGEEDVVAAATRYLAESILNQAVSLFGIFSFLSLLLLISAGMGALALGLREQDRR